MLIPPKSELWKLQLDSFWKSEDRRNLSAFLKKEQIKHTVVPSPYNYFEALDYCTPGGVKVVIVGQDPYPDSKSATGMAFSVPIYVEPEEFPGSLKNIFRALKIDLGINNKNGNLKNWAYQGVLLLNQILSVREGEAMSHKNKGWEKATDIIIENLAKGDKPVVFMLWGAEAAKKESLIVGTNNLILKTAHPSPRSAYKGFLWSKSFSKANEFLVRHGYLPIDWRT